MKNYFLPVLVAICFFSACSTPPPHYLSTSKALACYNEQLKKQGILVFPELRENPIRWPDSIPERKIKPAINLSRLNLAAQPGEFYVFQLGVWALRKDVQDLQVIFSGLNGKNGKTILPEKMTCFNSGGIDFKGEQFSKAITIPAGRIQALWVGIDLSDKEKGTYSGLVTVSTGKEKHSVPIRLTVSGEALPNHGCGQGNRLSRLNWLNSTTGIDENLTKGYIPVNIENRTVSILGRELNISENGLPEAIVSYFASSNQALADKGQEIVKQAFRFVIEKKDGSTVRLSPGELTVKEQTPSKVAWKVQNTSDECALEVYGQMEFDGFVGYKLRLVAKTDLNIKDIRLEIPVEKEKAEYMMGLGHEGGCRTPNWKWKWDISKNQDMLWLGSVNGGLRIKWKAGDYVRPLVNIYYGFGPLKMPISWGNGGKGGVNVTGKGNQVVVNAYSGEREIKAGGYLNFDFELLVTPLKILDRHIKFGDRYYHGGGNSTSGKIADAKKAGANIINIHHAEDIYPFINYPYLDANVDGLKQLVTNAHDKDMRMKFYYTTRELTKNLPEFWAFYSLGGEVIYPGPGNESRTEALHPDGPNEWLVKNLREKYIPAWYNPIKEGKFKGETDLSVITAPDSRLNNFYIAGLEWMVGNIGIDGVYIDDSALDRFTLRRARKVIDQSRTEGRIDLHSWNHFCKSAGFASCLNLYMDLLPYLDLVWIGEGRDYDRPPDHWLVEISGIPFGLAGQMLEGGGNPWRGMVYGITNRAGWNSPPPTKLWGFFDGYNFDEREMIGYWEKNCPVTCSNPNIKASVYKGKSDIVVAVANWGVNDEDFSLVLDETDLGILPYYKAKIPGIADFQEEQESVDLKRLTIMGKKGYLIVIKKQ